mgnify:CR=1 FL=1
MMASTGSQGGKESVWANLACVNLCKSYKLGRHDPDDFIGLKSVYCRLYPEMSESTLQMPCLYRKYASLTVHGKDYGSEKHSRLRQYGRIMALLYFIITLFAVACAAKFTFAA